MRGFREENMWLNVDGYGILIFIGNIYDKVLCIRI